MKSFTILLLLFLSVNLSFSQDIEKEKSNAEKFSSKSGKLIYQEFIEIGFLKDAKVQVVNYTDMMTDVKVSSVRITNKVKTQYTSDTKIAVLDSDEIDGLIKSIKLIQSDVVNTVPEYYTEVQYRSRAGFEAGCFIDGKDEWSTYVKLEKYDKDSYIFLELEDFELFLNLLEKCKAFIVN